MPVSYKTKLSFYILENACPQRSLMHQCTMQQHSTVSAQYALKKNSRHIADHPIADESGHSQAGQLHKVEPRAALGLSGKGEKCTLSGRTFSLYSFPENHSFALCIIEGAAAGAEEGREASRLAESGPALPEGTALEEAFSEGRPSGGIEAEPAEP